MRPRFGMWEGLEKGKKKFKKNRKFGRGKERKSEGKE